MESKEEEEDEEEEDENERGESLDRSTSFVGTKICSTVGSCSEIPSESITVSSAFLSRRLGRFVTVFFCFFCSVDIKFGPTIWYELVIDMCVVRMDVL